MATGVTGQFLRGSAPGKVKRLQYLIESFSALSAPSICRFFSQTAVSSRQFAIFHDVVTCQANPCFKFFSLMEERHRIMLARTKLTKQGQALISEVYLSARQLIVLELELVLELGAVIQALLRR
jgi:hypothetical protein